MINQKISIDLGSRNIRFLSGDRVEEVPCSIILKQDRWTGKLTNVVAFGENFANRTLSEGEQLIYPIRQGRIFDKRSAVILLDNIFKRYMGKVNRRKIGVVCFVACSLNSVERRQVADVLDELGFGQVDLVEACCAVHSYIGAPNTFTVDIGSDTTEIAVVSKGSIVFACDLGIGASSYNDCLVRYVTNQFGVTIDAECAEQVAFRLNSILPYEQDVATVSGVTGDGFVRSVELNASDMYESIKDKLYYILETIKVVWDGMPLNLVDYFSANGIYLLGGGSKMRGMQEFFKENLEIPIQKLDKGDEIIVLGGKEYLQIK